jgi:hypothetical protein
MLAALCLAMVFAICLTSYVALCYASVKTSTRNLMSLHCIELAETGLEQALYSQNNNDWTSQSWITTSGPTPTATLAQFVTPTPSILPENGETWEFKIQVTNYGTSSPQFQSWGIVTLPDGTTESRELATPPPSAGLNLPAPVPVFVNALAATTSSVTFGGTALVDSYSSNPYVAPGGYSAVVVSGNQSTNNAGVYLNTGTVIQGYAVGTNATAPSISYNSSSLVIGPPPSSQTSLDHTRLIYNPFPYQPQLTESTPGVGFSLDSVLSGAPPWTIGSPTATAATIYNALNSVNLSGSSAILNILGPVILTIPGNLNISGGAQIVIASTNPTTGGGPLVSLEIHLKSGSMTIGDNGIVNTPQEPRRLIIMGTSNTMPQTIGDGTLSNPIFIGAIYFPNAALSIVGSSNNPTIYGSLVAQSINIAGTTTIHYDMALRSPPAPSLVGYPAFSSFNLPYYNPAVPPIAVGTVSETVPAATPPF